MLPFNCPNLVGGLALLFLKNIQHPPKLRLVSKYDVLKKVNIGVFLET